MDNLQWFKFSPSHWFMGRIQRCSDVAQARFIRLCCIYWNNECHMDIQDAEIELGEDEFRQLLKLRIIESNADGSLVIKFLDEQYESCLDLSNARSKAAKARWNKPKQDSAKAMQLHTSAMQDNADKIREEENRLDKKRTDKQIPAYEDFKEYALDKCSELNFNVSDNQINAKYQSWKGNNWRNGNGKQIKNWKSTLLNTLPYMNQKETIEKPETVEEKDAREFMENLKKESINQILYPDVQSNFNDNEPANVSRVQRISNRPAGDGVDKAD